MQSNASILMCSCEVCANVTQSWSELALTNTLGPQTPDADNHLHRKMQRNPKKSVGPNAHQNAFLPVLCAQLVPGWMPGQWEDPETWLCCTEHLDSRRQGLTFLCTWSWWGRDHKGVAWPDTSYPWSCWSCPSPWWMVDWWLNSWQCWHLRRQERMSHFCPWSCRGDGSWSQQVLHHDWCIVIGGNDTRQGNQCIFH